MRAKYSKPLDPGCDPMNPIFQYVAWFTAFVASGAGVVGYFKANVSKSTIELYKEDNEALRLRLTTLESEKKEADARIAALENANKFLGSVVTQAEAIAYVKATVEKNTLLLEKIALAAGA